MHFRTFAVIAVVILAVAILTGGPWNTERIPPNPGLSGTPGSLYQPLVWFQAGRLSVTHHSACCEPFAASVFV